MVGLMPHCPVCGEAVSFFDRMHLREKHPEYFHTVRKWQFANSLSLISESVFLIIGALSASSFVKGLALGGALIALAFVFFTLLKWLSVSKKYKVSWRKTLPLTSADN